MGGVAKSLKRRQTTTVLYGQIVLKCFYYNNYSKMYNSNIFILKFCFLHHPNGEQCTGLTTRGFLPTRISLLWKAGKPTFVVGTQRDLILIWALPVAVRTAGVHRGRFFQTLLKEHTVCCYQSSCTVCCMPFKATDTFSTVKHEAFHAKVAKLARTDASGSD